MKLSKLSIPYRASQKFFGVLIFAIFISPGSLTVGSAAVVLGVLMSILGLSILVIAYEYLYWKNFVFTVEEDGLKIMSGVISKNDRDIPLKRIQNIDINRNILQRMLGIAKADIETAGGGGTEASLKYVEYEDAQRLQKDVRELKNRRKSDTKEKGSKKERDDFVLSDKDLTVLSLVSAADIRLLIGAGFLISFLAGSVNSQLEGFISQAAGTAAIILLGVIVVSGAWLSNAASKFIEYYNFRLSFHENALEYERGLFNRASGTIPEEKIQDIIIEENVVQRYFGYASLEVETAGYSLQQGETDTGSETVIPLAKRQEIEKFAQEIGGYTAPEFKRVSEGARKRYFRRYLFSGLLIGILTVALGLTFDLSWPVYIPAVLLLLSSKKAAELRWRSIGYYLDGKRVFTKQGFWNRKTYVIPYFRIQNFIQTETVFQRRWNQSTLLLDTAGSTRSYPQIIDMDSENAEVLRLELFDSFKESLQR